MRYFVWSGILFGCWWFGTAWFSLDHDTRETLTPGAARQVSLTINQHDIGRVTTDAKTVADLLRSFNITLRKEDTTWPAAETMLFSGMQVSARLTRPVTLSVDGRTVVVYTAADTAEAILSEQNIVLDEDDIVTPARDVIVKREEKILVTRVEIREEAKDTPIDFSTKAHEDETLSWRTKKVTQKGEKGLKRTTYRVSYHDGKEVRRKVMGTDIVKEPVPEIVTQGTLVKVGKSHRGAASWYAWTGTMAAANPWLPKGSYVRVTNLDNGKSVIVVINDRGPFVPGRIIDLDKVAFAKIASVGAGVINVKMEEITN